MTTYLDQLRHLYELYPVRFFSAIALGTALGLFLFWLFVRNRRPSVEEVERLRRDRLTRMGRITDGHLLDARTLANQETVSPTPDVLVYSYRLAGVTYNCAQDVSLLSERVRGYSLDQPIQVRYDPRNPGNSIVVAEEWSGLWEHRARMRNAM